MNGGFQSKSGTDRRAIPTCGDERLRRDFYTRSERSVR